MALKDSQTYPTGTKVTDEELAALYLLKDAFHGEWNYTILPQASPSSGQLIWRQPLASSSLFLVSLIFFPHSIFQVRIIYYFAMAVYKAYSLT